MIVDGRELEVEAIAGEPGAPTLVFLHEGLGSAGLWRDVPQALSTRTGCGVLNYSRYGNGHSQPLSESRIPRYMHDEALRVLPELLEAHCIRDVVLVGHSDGASIALIYAAEHPERVRGVVLEAPHVFVEDLSVRSIAQAKVLYETGALRAKLARHHDDVDRTFYGWNDIWLHPDFRAWNIQEYAHRLSAPVLLIQGADDEYGSLAQLEAIRTCAIEARIETLVLAQCGHSPHRDRPAATLDAIANFVAEIRRAMD